MSQPRVPELLCWKEN